MLKKENPEGLIENPFGIMSNVTQTDVQLINNHNTTGWFENAIWMVIYSIFVHPVPKRRRNFMKKEGATLFFSPHSFLVATDPGSAEKGRGVGS